MSIDIRAEAGVVLWGGLWLQAGTPLYAHVFEDQDGRSRGMGVVEMSTAEEAQCVALSRVLSHPYTITSASVLSPPLSCFRRRVSRNTATSLLRASFSPTQLSRSGGG